MRSVFRIACEQSVEDFDATVGQLGELGLIGGGEVDFPLLMTVREEGDAMRSRWVNAS
ncbi:MAG: hypothetical protein R3B67_00280 [Phycisphaerales bacterium]